MSLSPTIHMFDKQLPRDIARFYISCSSCMTFFHIQQMAKASVLKNRMCLLKFSHSNATTLKHLLDVGITTYVILSVRKWHQTV